MKGIADRELGQETLMASVRYANFMCIVMWMILLILYGTFIPNTLWRGIVVMGLMTVAPVVIVIAVPFIYPSLMPTLTFGEASPIAVVMMAAFAAASYGSNKIGSLRREAFEARRLGQYRLTEFIGAGGMIRSGFTMSGITTAATLWFAAAVGVATGFGFYLVAVVGLVVALISMIGFAPIRPLMRRGSVHAVEIRYQGGHGTLTPLFETLNAIGAQVHRISMVEDGGLRTMTC